jgi:hypothetical protein
MAVEKLCWDTIFCITAVRRVPKFVGKIEMRAIRSRSDVSRLEGVLVNFSVRTVSTLCGLVDGRLRNGNLRTRYTDYLLALQTTAPIATTGTKHIICTIRNRHSLCRSIDRMDTYLCRVVIHSGFNWFDTLAVDAVANGMRENSDTGTAQVRPVFHWITLVL